MDSKKRARQAAEPSKNLDRPLNAYQQTIRDFSDRLIEAQKSLRVLDAVKWGADVEERFFLQKCRELPDVHLAYYQNRPLAFDPAAKKRASCKRSSWTSSTISEGSVPSARSSAGYAVNTPSSSIC